MFRAEVAMQMKRRITGNEGMTLVEIMVGMTLFAIGVLSLTQVMFQAMHANVRSKHVVVATNLAHQRMEQIMSSTRYDNITAANFPSEGFGAVEGGKADYAVFQRTVAIADSTDALGTSVMKDVTVRVAWHDSNGLKNVQIRSNISRFKDIKL
jgi:prepilin-type N-terminal cleavage/methylation domain-containing protein